ncbi:hypothetical protein LPJ70_001547, partial [Coemansia sp. RSA 2708]
MQAAVSLPAEQRITQTLFQGDKFVDQYYRSFGKSVGKFYTADTRVIWNGAGMTGAQFLQTLPQLQAALSGFDVTSYDVQPFGELAMVSVSGTVRLNGKAQFVQYFVVKKTGSLTYIVSDCFRLV